MSRFFQGQLDYIFFVSGLSFLVLAALCTRILGERRTGLPWRYLGLFGMTQAINEWLELLTMSLGSSVTLRAIRLGVAALSFLFLMEFGRLGMGRMERWGPGRWIYLLLAFPVVFGGVFGIAGLDASVRYSLGFLGGLSSGFVLFRASRIKETDGRPLTLAAIATVAYAVASGAIPPAAPFIPASVLNQSSFLLTVGTPVQLWSGAFAFLITVAIWWYYLRYKKAALEAVPRIDARLYGFQIVMMFVAVLGLGWISTQYAGSRADQDIRRDLLNRTEIAAAGLDPECIRHITHPSGMVHDADRLRLSEQLTYVEKANPDIRRAYLGVPVDGMFTSRIDGLSEGSRGHGDNGPVIQGLPKELYDVYMSGAPLTVGPDKDALGPFISGCAPVRELVSGRVLAVLGMDVNAAGLEESIALNRLVYISITFAISIILIAFAITRQRLYESTQRVAASERRLIEAQEVSRIGSWTYDPRADQFAWSEEMFRVFGLVPGGPVPSYSDYQNFLHPEDWPRLDKTIQKSIKEGEGYELEYRVIWPDSSVRYIVSRAEVKRGTDGGVVQLLGTAQDITKRKRAEEEIRASSERLKGVIETVGEGISVSDRAGHFEIFNRALEAITGYTKAEANAAVDFSALLYQTEGQRQVALDGLKILLESGHTHEVETTIRDKNGSLKTVLVSSTIIEYKNQQMFLSAWRDITERKRMEQALRESEEKFRLIFENAYDGISIFEEAPDPDQRRLIECNARYAEMAGRSREDLLSRKTMKGLAKPLTRKSSRDIARGRVFRGSFSWIRPDGKDNIIEYTGVPIKIQGKSYSIGIDRDVTERRQAEEALRDSEKRYRSLFEESKDAVFISSPKGRFVDINPAGIELLGYTSKDEILALDIENELYVDVGQRKEFQRLMEQQGFVKDFEEELKRKDGQELYVLETATVVKDKHGRTVMYRGILRDVTRQKRLEQELIQAQKLESLGTLAGGIAHDFNNILAIIMGHAALLERDQARTSAQAASIESINTATQRGAGLVRHLLTFARKSDVRYEPLSIIYAVNELTRLLAETFPKTINIEVEIDNDLPMIHADANQFHVILLNLCVNARDAMPKGGTLSIMAARSGGGTVKRDFPKANASEYVHIRVSDTGVGMDEATRKRLFEPFFTTKDRGKGTGLGLATVYGVVEGHQGFVDIESTVGVGTTVHIFLPVRQRPPEFHASSLDSVVEARGGNETILLVEDEKMLCELVKTVLSSQGYAVLTATDGADAIKMYEDHGDAIALVVSDVGLPKLPGTDVFARLHAMNPNVKVILASGYWEPHAKSEILKAGAKACIEKPYNQSELLANIRRIIDG